MSKPQWEMKYGPETFSIPSQIIQNRNLRPSDFIVYGAIHWLFHMKGYCNATNAVLATISGVRQRSVQGSLSRLKNEKIIEIEGGSHLTFRSIVPMIKAPIHREGKIPKCEYCGCEEESILTYDHKIPVKKGGKTVPDNMALACMPCNYRKSTKDLNEFLKQHKK